MKIYWSKLRESENLVGRCSLYEKGSTRSKCPWKSAYSHQSPTNVLLLSLLRLRQKFRYPYQSMQANVRRLQRLQQASDVLRRTSRFTVLAKRLQTQMAEVGDSPGGAAPQPKASESKSNSGVLDGRRSATPGLDYEGEKERSLAQAALTVAELGTAFIKVILMYQLNVYITSGDLLETSLDVPETIPEEELSPTDAGPSAGKHIPLRSINAVAAHVPSIESARSKITSEMESMVLEGLAQVASHLDPRSRRAPVNLPILCRISHCSRLHFKPRTTFGSYPILFRISFQICRLQSRRGSNPLSICLRSPRSST